MADPPPINLAVLVSGSGTTLQNLLDAIARRELNAVVRLVVGSKPGLKGLDRAAAAGIPTAVIDRRPFDAAVPFSRAVFAEIDRAGVDLVCLAGWLCLLDVPDRWAGRVMNIHPALLPSFGGRGLYGRRVHQAVLDHGCKVSGCTVHFVDNDYDAGPIILQRTCPVAEDDTAETLAARVFEQECVAYPEAVRMFQDGRLRMVGRRVAVDRAEMPARKA
jgi:phosphoribosylglycinamide formyltransferase-1